MYYIETEIIRGWLRTPKRRFSCLTSPTDYQESFTSPFTNGGRNCGAETT